MNDYVFTIEVSQKDGSGVTNEKFVVSGENIEKAYEKIHNKIFDRNLRFNELTDVKKL